MNNKKLFVGNLTYSVRDGQLRALFSRYGEVVSVRVIEKKGYGFVEMGTSEQADTARDALNETEFEGRNLLIDGIRPPLKSKPPSRKAGTGNDRGRISPRSGYRSGPSGSGYRGKKSSSPHQSRSGSSGQKSRSGSSRPSRRQPGHSVRRHGSR